MSYRIYKVTFGYKHATNYESVNVLADNAKVAIQKSEKHKLSSWYVSSVELLATADY